MQTPHHIQPPPASGALAPAAPRRHPRRTCCLFTAAALAIGCCGVLVVSILIGTTIFEDFEIVVHIAGTAEPASSDPTPPPLIVQSERDLSKTAVQELITEQFATGNASDLLTWAGREGYMPTTQFGQIVNWAQGAVTLPQASEPTGTTLTTSNNARAEIVALGDAGLIVLDSAQTSPSIWLVHVSGTASAPVLHLATSIQGAIIEGRYTPDAVSITVNGDLVQQRTVVRGVVLVSGNRMQSTCTTGATDEIVALMTTQAFAAGATTAAATMTGTYFTLKGEPQKGAMAAMLAISTSASMLLMTDFDALAAAFEDNPPTFRLSDPKPNGQWHYFCSEDAQQVLRAPYYNYQINAQDDREPPPEICEDPACTMINGVGSAGILLHANEAQAFTIHDCGGNTTTGRVDIQTDRIQVYAHCDGPRCVESLDEARCAEASDAADTGGFQPANGIYSWQNLYDENHHYVYGVDFSTDRQKLYWDGDTRPHVLIAPNTYYLETESVERTVTVISDTDMIVHEFRIEGDKREEHSGRLSYWKEWDGFGAEFLSQ